MTALIVRTIVMENTPYLKILLSYPNGKIEETISADQLETIWQRALAAEDPRILEVLIISLGPRAKDLRSADPMSANQLEAIWQRVLAMEEPGEDLRILEVLITLDDKIISQERWDTAWQRAKDGGS